MKKKLAMAWLALVGVVCADIVNPPPGGGTTYVTNTGAITNNATTANVAFNTEYIKLPNNRVKVRGVGYRTEGSSRTSTITGIGNNGGTEITVTNNMSANTLPMGTNMLFRIAGVTPASYNTDYVGTYSTNGTVTLVSTNVQTWSSGGTIFRMVPIVKLTIADVSGVQRATYARVKYNPDFAGTYYACPELLFLSFGTGVTIANTGGISPTLASSQGPIPVVYSLNKLTNNAYLCYAPAAATGQSLGQNTAGMRGGVFTYELDYDLTNTVAITFEY